MPRSPVRGCSCEREKDQFIGGLKAENYNLHREQAEIDELDDNLHSAQYALDKATGELFKLENEFKIQVDNDAIIINRLKNKGIDLKQTIDDKNAEISQLKYNLDMFHGKRNNLSNEFRINKDDNSRLIQIAEGLDKDVKYEVDVNNAVKRELDDLNPRISRLSDDIHQHHHYIDELECKVIDSRKQCYILNADIDSVELKSCDATARISVLDGRVRDLRPESADLDCALTDLKNKHDAELTLYEQIHNSIDKEIHRGDDLRVHYKRTKDEIEAKRVDADTLGREANDLNDMIKQVTAVNADLEYQIGELGRHIDVLGGQNTNLNIELDSILDKDRIVREELDRRSKIANRKRLNEESLRKSLQTLSVTKLRSNSNSKGSPSRLSTLVATNN